MIGKILSGKYAIKHEVGRGGMGVIYEALHTALNRTVAIKVLHAQFTKDRSFLDRFQREARAMARLDHKNIIRIFDVLEDQNTHYIVMEYFQGKNLRQILAKKKTLSQRAVLSITYQIAKGLSYAHEQGIIHRDIKPANIIVNPNGIAKIADFGIAAATDEITLSTTNHIIGTPEYMSLEQARGENLDGRSDLYSLGMVCYEMLCGKTCYSGMAGPEILKKLAYDLQEFELTFEPSVSQALQNLIKTLLKKNKTDRTSDASSLIQQIKTAKTSLKTELPQVKPLLKKPEAWPFPEHPVEQEDGKPPMFVAARPKTTEPVSQQTGSPLKQEERNFVQKPVSRLKWHRALAGLSIVALLLGGIAYTFFTSMSEKPLPNELQKEIQYIQSEITAVQQQMIQTHQKSKLSEIRSWSEESYAKASDLENKAVQRLNEAHLLLKKQDYPAAEKSLKNAHVLFKQAHEGFLHTIETAHEKIAQEEIAKIEKEKRAQEATIELARLKKEGEQLIQERKKQEALLQSKLIKLGKETTRTEKSRVALKQIQSKNKPPIPKMKSTEKREEKKQAQPSETEYTPPMNEIDSLGAVLGKLTAAYEKKDLNTLQKMSIMSESRGVFLKQVFKNYERISVSVTDLSILEKHAEAVITITELKTHDGKRVRPPEQWPDQWKNANLAIPKNKGEWDKIIW